MHGKARPPHELAIQEVNVRTVLGDFNNAKFKHGDVESVFFKKDGKFMVRTDGPDGKLTDYPITYTFGVTPLQQYLIAFPGGRFQALSIAWDSRPEAEGGQRWFHLYPKEKMDNNRPVALDQALPELEHGMRRVSLDKP